MPTFTCPHCSSAYTFDGEGVAACPSCGCDVDHGVKPPPVIPVVSRNHPVMRAAARFSRLFSIAVLVVVGFLALIVVAAIIASRYVEPTRSPLEPVIGRSSPVSLSIWEFKRSEFGNQFACGTVTNNTSSVLPFVSIRFDVMNDDGVKIGEASDSIGSIDPGQAWAYRALVDFRGSQSVKVRLKEVTCRLGKLY